MIMQYVAHVLGVNSAGCMHLQLLHRLVLSSLEISWSAERGLRNNKTCEYRKQMGVRGNRITKT